VKDDLRNLGRTAKEVAKDKLGNAKQVAKDKLDDAKGKAAHYVEEGKQKSTELFEQGKQRATEVEDQVETYIRQKPLKSVMIAAGAGVLLGFLLSRR
jgi:ElaB/YqjD/DUF883 family membrane-anchored ribosome-binding protein